MVEKEADLTDKYSNEKKAYRLTYQYIDELQEFIKPVVLKHGYFAGNTTDELKVQGYIKNHLEYAFEGGLDHFSTICLTDDNPEYEFTENFFELGLSEKALEKVISNLGIDNCLEEEKEALKANSRWYVGALRFLVKGGLIPASKRRDKFSINVLFNYHIKSIQSVCDEQSFWYYKPIKDIIVLHIKIVRILNRIMKKCYSDEKGCFVKVDDDTVVPDIRAAREALGELDSNENILRRVYSLFRDDGTPCPVMETRFKNLESLRISYCGVISAMIEYLGAIMTSGEEGFYRLFKSVTSAGIPLLFLMPFLITRSSLKEFIEAFELGRAEGRQQPPTFKLSETMREYYGSDAMNYFEFMSIFDQEEEETKSKGSIDQSVSTENK